MALTFRFIDARAAGNGGEGPWKHAFNRHWPAYRRWFLSEGVARRATFEAGERAMREQMPELVGLYRQLCRASGGDDIAARFLSMYRPPAYATGCSQLAAWADGQPTLIRNYDYNPQLFEGTVMLTHWAGKSVIATIDCLWGCLDGLNEDGLAVSLAFGGSREVGTGFGVPIILRYLLQTCSATEEAVAALGRVSCNMAYNVTLTDCAGDARTIELFPGEPPRASGCAYAANQQSAHLWPAYAALSRSAERMAVLESLSRAARGSGARRLARAFQTPPLRSVAYDRGFGTLYTCMLSPRAGDADYIWADQLISQSFDAFTECEVQINLACSAADPLQHRDQHRGPGAPMNA